MFSRSISRPLWSTGYHLLTFCLTLSLLLSFVPLAQAQDAAPIPTINPTLQRMAAQQPEGMIPVIVQKSGIQSRSGRSIEARVVELGGVNLMDLPLVGGFATELPGATLAELAGDPAVTWISYDAPMMQVGSPINTGQLANMYIPTIGADRVWNEQPYIQGDGIGVAIIDSGVMPWDDIKKDLSGNTKLRARISVTGPDANDTNGHGTHIAGIVGGSGWLSGGMYMGVAPEANLIVVKVSDDQGASRTSDVIDGLWWTYKNKDLYNIRVVNLSLNSAVPEPYQSSPLSAAVEFLWFNGIVVVVSAGNNGTDNGPVELLPPANDPFVITVGATDDQGTASPADDVLASFSAYGVTAEGFAKPDIVAPGRNIVSLMGSPDAHLVKEHPNHVVKDSNMSNTHYFRMSGTSMAAPMVSGAVALLLQDEPALTPDQVKHRLMATARPFTGSQPGSGGAGYLDVYAAVNGTTTESANTGTAVSWFWSIGDGETTWNSVNWNSVNWNSVNWNSVNWNSVNWNSVNWNSVNWSNSLWDKFELMIPIVQSP